MLTPPSIAALAFISLSLSVLAGCGAPAERDTDTQHSEDELVSASEPAIHVEVGSSLEVVGTPTYGYDATAVFLSADIYVEDAKLRRSRPGFDGYEVPFVLLPRADASTGHARWERLELRYKGSTLRGYYGERRFDIYELEPQRLTEADFDEARAHGIAAGLETNVGTVWAQAPGKNFPVPAAVFGGEPNAYPPLQ